MPLLDKATLELSAEDLLHLVAQAVAGDCHFE